MPQFQQLVLDTAVQGIENHFEVKFDKRRMKHLKSVAYKGKPQPSLLRKKTHDMCVCVCVCVCV